MPEFERYPNESPMAAKKRIAKNVARSSNNPNSRNNPGAVNVPAGVAPRPVGNVPPVNVATKPEMMGEGYPGPVQPESNLSWNDPNEGTPVNSKRTKPGYNISKNLGDTPDIGY